MGLVSLVLTAVLLLLQTCHAQVDVFSCGKIAEFVRQEAEQALPIAFDVSIAVDCLRSVPIDKDASAQFIKSINASQFQFMSTTAFLKNPPSGYQQPGVDLQGRLQHILQDTLSGQYENQYDFEVDLYNLARSAHEGHFEIQPPTLSAVRFAGPYQLVAVSSDGQQLPAVYAFLDLNETVAGNAHGWKASPLSIINGLNANDYLEQFATNFSLGQLDPHADWNYLFENPASLVQNGGGLFAGGVGLFMGDWFNVTFDNGTMRSDRYSAFVFPDSFDAWLNIVSGQDFYESFVKLPNPINLRDKINDFKHGLAVTSSTAAAMPSAKPTALSAWDVPAYPKPFVVQSELGIVGPNQTGVTSWATGYVLNASSTAVLSIPCFTLDGQSFSDLVQRFLEQAKQRGVKRILIDVQANGGGLALMAPELYKHFFPTQYPFTGSQCRIHESANIFGEAYSKFAVALGNNNVSRQQQIELINSTMYGQARFNGWNAGMYIDAATGSHFTSWDDIISEGLQDGDRFSKTALIDLQNTEVTNALGGITVYGFGNRTTVMDQPYEAKDIAILTNGNCASTCAVFAELFRSAGVKVVTAGGLPKFGKMQGVGGTRGAEVSDQSQLALAAIAAGALGILDDEAIDRLDDIVNTGIRVDSSSLSFSFRSQVRPNSSIPLQFLYEPADCRIFYTPETFNNFTALWTYAAEAIFDNPSMCVKGSTGGRNNTIPGANVTGSKNSTIQGTNVSTFGKNSTFLSPNVAGGANGGNVSTSHASVIASAGWLAIILPVIAIVLL